MCAITHILQDSSGVSFALNMEKIPLTLTFLHSRRGWRGRQISGMYKIFAFRKTHTLCVCTICTLCIVGDENCGAISATAILPGQCATACRFNCRSLSRNCPKFHQTCRVPVLVQCASSLLVLRAPIVRVIT